MKLAEAIDRYVGTKQATGASFKWGTGLLRAFRYHVGDISLCSITTSQVSDFLERSVSSDRTRFSRHRLLKAFFDHWIARNELAGLPLPPSRHRRIARKIVPYIYSISELRKLLDATSQTRQRNSLREFSSMTFRMLILFLYGTGARVDETLHLAQEDVDLKKATITFHRPPSGAGRTVPIGPHLCEALREYAAFFASHDARKAFFTRRDGKPVVAIALSLSFQKLRCQAGIARPGEKPQPQMRDLRRTFAVHCMRNWLQEGRDLRTMLPLLGAYLGHVSLSSTEAYLALTPERFRVQLTRLGSARERLNDEKLSKLV
jgi:integrase/recombinase XerD